MAKSAEAILNKWVNGATQAANGAYKEGILGVTSSPMEKAAAKANEWASGVQRALADGSFVNGLRKVSLSQWQQSASTKGVTAYSNGITHAKDKMRAFIQQNQPFWAQVSEQARAMPKGDLEAGIARVRMVCQAMKTQFGKT